MDSRISGHDAIRATLSLMTLALFAACGGEPDQDMAEEAAPGAAPAAAMPAATQVEAMELQTGAQGLAGMMVRVDGIGVVSRLGEQAFWVELPNGNPFLIRTQTPDATGVGATVDIVGTVVLMNDSILNEWVSSGAITENQRLEAEFAAEFIETEVVMESEAPAGGM